jgi:hypothetical protein
MHGRKALQGLSTQGVRSGSDKEAQGPVDEPAKASGGLVKVSSGAPGEEVDILKGRVQRLGGVSGEDVVDGRSKGEFFVTDEYFSVKSGTPNEKFHSNFDLFAKQDD